MSRCDQQMRSRGALGSAGPLTFSATNVRFLMTFKYDGTHLRSVNLKASREGGTTCEFTNILFMETDTTASIFGIEVNDEVRDIRPGGCAEFCVNGQSTAGASRPVRKHNEHKETTPSKN